MDLRELRIFVKAAEKLNFSRTAEELGYTQANVTLQIKNLEAELGVLLFDRIGKNIYLTQDGNLFLTYARQVLSDSDSLKELFHTEKRHAGKINVGMSESILAAEFPGMIQEYHRKYPKIQVCVKVGTREMMYDMLLHNELDFAYIIDQNSIGSEWVGRVIKEETVYFLASPEHPLAGRAKRGEKIGIEEILNEELILTECHVGYSYALSQLLSLNGMTLSPYLETGNTEVIRRLLEQNQGISYLPLYIVEKELAGKTIVPIRIPEYEVLIYRQVFWHKNKFLTVPMKEFMRLLEDRSDPPVIPI